MHFAALRVHARHDVLDDAVLARGVERLEDEEHGPAILRVEALLQRRHPLHALVEQLRRRLAERQPALVVGLDVPQFETVAASDPIAA